MLVFHAFFPLYHDNFVPMPYWNYDFKTFEFEKRKKIVLKPILDKGENMNRWNVWIVTLVVFLDYIQM
jgi:hypothetical protein